MAQSILTVDNPFTFETACEVPVVGLAQAFDRLERARRAAKAWAGTALRERVELVVRFANAFVLAKEPVALDLARMMGKPLSQARAEVDTLADRARTLAALAPAALAELELPFKEGFARTIAREPLGVVLVVAPWNYPLLTAVNAVAAAVLAGNGVILKHSSRTPLCGAHFEAAFRRAGAPEDLVSAVALGHAETRALIGRPEVGYVAFTGSVEGGRELAVLAARRFIGVGLELGGKDAAYVLDDADLGFAAKALAEGAFYNAGQSCCGVKRIFVARALYERFQAAFTAEAAAYRPGDPMDPATTLGPLALPETPAHLARQVASATRAGARLLFGGCPSSLDGRGRFFPPTAVVDATAAMEVMAEESFGPLVALAQVASDEEAVARINESRFGLTASLFTADAARARALGQRLDVGTVFMNRCDYLDPRLPWVGVKDSGLGLSLSHLGLALLTRPKSYHFRLAARVR